MLDSRIAFSLAVFATLYVGAPSATAQDFVKLEGGRSFKGRVVFHDTERVIIRKGSRDKEFAHSEIAEVRSVNLEMGSLLDQLSVVPTNDAYGQAEMARYAHENGLEGMARALWLRVLLLDDKNEEAYKALEGRKRSGKWCLRHEGRWYSFKDLDKETKKWGKHWTLETLHYRVLSNLPLNEVIGLAIDAERTHRFFFRLVGRPLQLKDTVELTTIEAHADSRSFPEGIGSDASYFQPSSRTAFVNASRKPYRGAVLHELTHSLIHATVSNESRGSGSVAAWVDEGFAEYVSARAVGSPFGNVEFNPNVKNQRWLRMIADHDEPYDLNRVLNLSTSEFQTSSNAQLMYAQVYALVEYCLHGEDESLRAGFFEFVHDAYRGSSSSTDFKKLVVGDNRTFEADWHKYVKNSLE